MGNKINNWNKFLEGFLHLDNSIIEVFNSMDSRLAPIIIKLNDKWINDILYNFLKYNGDENFVDFFLDGNLDKIEIVIRRNVGNFINFYNFKGIGYLFPGTKIEDHDIRHIFKEGSRWRVSNYIVRDYNSDYLANDRIFVVKWDGDIRTVNADYCDILWRGNKLSIGKVISDILKKSNISFTSVELESFVNEFKSKSESFRDIENRFSIVSGEDIRKFYLDDNNENATKGTLQKSCMNDIDSQYFLDIYVDNDNISLLILRSMSNSELIVARALLWNFNGRIIMDRIYYSSDYQVNLFIDYAKERGWIYKKVQSVKDDTLIDSKTGGEYNVDVKIYLDFHNYSYYPYVDTFKYLNKHEGFLTNKMVLGHMELDQTDGGITYYHEGE